ncbi:hypothetical protein H0H93_003370 [Arthromyces matolae]|nr:hypothetical protein H0H93_003370 [Arthromyces matolae]
MSQPSPSLDERPRNFFRFAPSSQQEPVSKRTSADWPNYRVWRNIEGHRRSLIKCSTLSDEAVPVIEAELREILEKGNIKIPPPTTSPDAVARMLTRSNQRPNLSQASVLQALISQNNSEIDRIDSDALRIQLQVRELIKTLADLERQRSRRQEEVRYHESWLSSARALPLEVLTRIFYFAIEYHGPSSRRTSPQSLSHVNSIWRRAAVSYSKFWNVLEFGLGAVGHLKGPVKSMPSSLLETWYGRSNLTQPLSLRFDIHGQVSTQRQLDFVAGIAKFCMRISNVVVFFTGRSQPHAFGSFFTVLGGAFQSLETLTIIDKGEKPEDYEEQTPITIFEHSPSLRKATLRVHGYMLEGENRLSIPWRQLSHLYMGGLVSLQSLANVIFQCPQLQSVTFPKINLAVQEDTPEPSIPDSPVIFQHLTEFKMGLRGPDFGDDDVWNIIDKIHLPSIRRFEVAGSFGVLNYTLIDPFPIFMSDPLSPSSTRFSHLSHLTLACVEFDDWDFLSMIKQCLLLESLSLCLLEEPIELLASLTRGNTEGGQSVPPPLSHLNSFTFAFVVHEEEPFDPAPLSESLIDLIASWATDPARRIPLKEVCLLPCYAYGRFKEHAFEQLSTLTEAGIANLREMSTCTDLAFSVTVMDSHQILLGYLGFDDVTDKRSHSIVHPFPHLLHRSLGADIMNQPSVPSDDRPRYSTRYTPSSQQEPGSTRTSTDSPNYRVWRNIEGNRRNLGSPLSDETVPVIEAELRERLEKGNSRIPTPTVSPGAVVGILARSNQRPNHSQASALQALILQKNSELERLDSDALKIQLQVRELITTLTDIEKQRSERQAEVQYHESWLRSVRALPLEVLTRIFYYAIQHYGPSNRRTSPQSLSHVSSIWRRAAVGYSKFWSKLEFGLGDVRYLERESTSMPLSLLESWYGRTNSNQPLSLRFNIHGPLTEEGELNFIRGISMFMIRITTFSVFFTGERHFSSLAGFFATSGGLFQSLEALTMIDINDKSDDDEGWGRVTVFDHSPWLRKATLRVHRSMLEGENRLFIPWHQLTHLYLGGLVSLRSLAIVIFQCSQLQTVAIPNVNLPVQTETPEPSIPDSPVIFHHLTQFKMRLRGTTIHNDLWNLISQIHLPSIRSFAVAGATAGFNDPGIFVELFPVFLDDPSSSTNFSHLRHLTLAFVDFDIESGFLRMINECSLLETLNLCYQDEPTQLLESLTRGKTQAGQPVAPALSHLRSFAFAFVVESKHYFVDPHLLCKSFVDLMTSWATSPGRTPLKDISLLPCYRTGDQDGFDEIASLTHEGVANLREMNACTDLTFSEDMVAGDSADESYDVGELTQSNHRLGEEKIQHFKSRIEQKNTELLRLDYDILRLQLQLNSCATIIRSLVHTRLEAQKKADLNHIWTSHARLLPMDVIKEILCYASTSFPHSRSSPIKLSHVCSSWRKAALTCSSLWTNLEINRIPFQSPSRRQSDVDWLISIFTNWFGHTSPGVPLSFELRLFFEDLDLELGRGLVQGILPFSHRITVLNITILTSYARRSWGSHGLEVLAPFLTLPEDTFPRLSRLTLHDFVTRRFPDQIDDQVIPKITVFGHSPLRHIFLDPQPWMFRGSQHLLLHWADLTHLNINRSISFHAFVNIIFQCRDLQDALFSEVFADTTDGPVVIPIREPVIFAGCSAFKLDIYGPGLVFHVVENLLSMIKLPVVEDFVLVTSTESGGTDNSDLPLHAIFPPHPSYSYCLRHLLLFSCTTSLGQLVDMIDACPLLEQLSLCLYSIDPTNLLNALSKKVFMGSGTLSHLVSFEFGFKVSRRRIEPLDQNEELNAVLTAFSNLIGSLKSIAAQSESQNFHLSALHLCVVNVSIPRPVNPMESGEKTLGARLEEHLKGIIQRDVGKQLGVRLNVLLASYQDSQIIPPPQSTQSGHLKVLDGLCTNFERVLLIHDQLCRDVEELPEDLVMQRFNPLAKLLSQMITSNHPQELILNSTLS